MSLKELGYELGVLMFRLKSEHPSGIKYTPDYDADGNLTALFNAAGILPSDDAVKEGFFAEGQNAGLPKGKVKDLYLHEKANIA